MFGSWEIMQFITAANPAISSEQDPVLPAQTVASIDRGTTSSRTTEQDAGTDNDDVAITEHHRSLARKMELLRSAKEVLKSKRNYKANLAKREVVHGELLEEQQILMKVRVQPFSVYLRWNTGDAGREVIFVEGANNGKMIAHDGGWKARLPAFYLEPTCSLAMRDARYPVTSAGLLYLIDTMLEVHEQDVKQQNFASCEMNEADVFDGRPAVSFVTCYRSKDVSPHYRKSITVFDRETSIPVATEHYEWPSRHVKIEDKNLDEATLIERYAFHDLAFDQEISERDFDRGNREYKFR